MTAQPWLLCSSCEEIGPTLRKLTHRLTPVLVSASLLSSETEHVAYNSTAWEWDSVGSPLHSYHQSHHVFAHPQLGHVLCAAQIPPSPFLGHGWPLTEVWGTLVGILISEGTITQSECRLSGTFLGSSATFGAFTWNNSYILLFFWGASFWKYPRLSVFSNYNNIIMYDHSASRLSNMAPKLRPNF